jgi:hypothetical protein
MTNGLMKMGAALAAGYLVGRTRRGRLILTAAALGMAARGGMQSRQGGLLEGPLGVVSREVASQVQAAAGQALTARVDRLSDSLKERTANLRPAEQAEEAVGGVAAAAGSAPQEEEEEEEAPSGEREEAGPQPAEGRGGQPPRAPQRQARGRSRSASTSGR